MARQEQLSSPEHPRRFIPLSPTAFYLLEAIRRDTKDGKSLIEDVERLSHGFHTISKNEGYKALNRYAACGLVDIKKDENHRRYNTYSLTTMGKEVLQMEADRMDDCCDLHYRVSNRNNITPKK